MSAYAFVPPITVLLPFEGLRLRIQLHTVLAPFISNGEQLRTISRFQSCGICPAHGEYIEGIAAVSGKSPLVLGVHRRLYVRWITPAANPALNFSRYYLSILALPINSIQVRLNQRAIILLQAQVLAKPNS